MSRRLAVGILVITGLIGTGMALYSLIAVFGPVHDLAPPYGPLHCHGSALTLHNRSSIQRKPQGLDCRSQARYQIAGGAASLAVGLMLLGTVSAVMALRKRDQDLQASNENGDWRVARPLQRLVVTPAAAFAGEALVASLVWPMSSLLVALSIAAASIALWLAIGRLRIRAESSGISVVRLVSHASVLYDDVAGIVAGGTGLTLFRRSGPCVTSGVVHKLRMPHSPKTTRADQVGEALATRTARYSGRRAEDYRDIPENARPELARRRRQATRRAIGALVVWLILSILGKVL